MTLTAAEIAKATGGTITGNPDTVVSHPAKLEEANSSSLCFFANPKYESALYASQAGVVIIPKGFQPSQKVNFSCVEHENPYYAYCIILDRFFNPNTHKSGIEAGSFIASSAQMGTDIYVGSTAYIDEDARIGNGVKIYPQVYIGKGAIVGDNCVLFPGVKIYAGCVIGDRCILHSGTVIGSDGFGFAPVGDIYMKIPQVGNVVVGNDCEIGSNCSIDRATMGSTRIGNGVKLDNLIQIAHNAEIGDNTVIAAQAGISGSTKIGANCQIGGQSGFVGHIKIANRTGIGAQSGISKEISEEGTNWIGSPAMPLKDFFKSQAVFKNLATLQQRINQLEKQLKNQSSED
jgi:UDP-3-O-[3-hydroxymyristoyl] glucosamine N-acyltransferase